MIRALIDCAVRRKRLMRKLIRHARGLMALIDKYESDFDAPLRAEWSKDLAWTWRKIFAVRRRWIIWLPIARWGETRGYGG